MSNRVAILEEVFAERERQLEFWPMEADNLNTRNDWAAFVSYYVNSGAFNGRKRVYSDAKFRANLVKAAAVCVAAIEAIDRQESLPLTELQKKLDRG